MNIKDKQVIGAIVVFAVLLGSGAYFYFSDVQTIWNACLNENPDLKYCVYSVEREDKGITQVELLTHNITTEDPTDFIRWRMSKDELTLYNGRFIGAKAKWYVDYLKTYGTDEWVNLQRKVRKIELEIETHPEDGFVILRKTTEYYATKSRSGTGGHLIEEFKVGQDWHKYTVEFIPSDNRMNTTHRLRWKLNSFGIGLEAERILKNDLILEFDRLVMVNWIDAQKDFNYGTLTSNNLEVIFNDKKGGNYFLDPSIGIGLAANDYFTLISNTDQCLSKCEAIFSITNPTDSLIETSDVRKYKFDFSRKSLESNNLKGWYVEVEEPVDYNYALTDTKEICEKEDVNKDGIDCWNEDYVSGYEIRERLEWQRKPINSIILAPLETKRVKIVGEKIPKTGENNIDWVPTVAGFRISEHAWWNSNWVNKRPIFLVAQDLNKWTTQELQIDFTDGNFSGKVLANLDDVRVVDENVFVELARVLTGTSSDTDANLFFRMNNALSSGASSAELNETYYIYYNNSGASAPTDRNAAMTTVCGWEDDETNCAYEVIGGSTISWDSKFGNNSRLIDNGDSIRSNIPLGFQSQDYNYSVYWSTDSTTADGKILYTRSAIDADLCYMQLAGDGLVHYFDGGSNLTVPYVYDINTWYRSELLYEDKGNCFWTIWNTDTNVWFTTSSAPRETAAPVGYLLFTVTTAAGDMYYDNMYLRPPIFDAGFGPEEDELVHLLDANIWQVEGYDLNAVIPSFSYSIDGNLEFTFIVRDTEGINDINFNMWYDVTHSGKTNRIIHDINLSTDSRHGDCDTNSKTAGMVCTWDWNIFGISDGNYWITMEFNNGSGDINIVSTEQSMKVEFNIPPDSNIWQVAGYDFNAGLPVFDYYSDGNLEIKFRVVDRDNDDLNFNMWYGTSPNAKTNRVIHDINLSTDTRWGSCDTNNKVNGAVCTWDLNIFEFSDNNYWITIEVNDGTDTNTSTSERSFRVNNPDLIAPSLTWYRPTSNITRQVNQLDVKVIDNNTVKDVWFDSNVSCFKPTTKVFYDPFDDNTPANTRDWYAEYPTYEFRNGFLHHQFIPAFDDKPTYIVTDTNIIGSDFNFHFEIKGEEDCFVQIYLNAQTGGFGAPPGYRIRYECNDNLQVTSDSTVLINPTVDLNDNEWTTIDLNRKDGIFTLHLNGENVGSSSWIDLNYASSPYFTAWSGIKDVNLDNFIYTGDLNFTGSDINAYWVPDSDYCPEDIFDANVTVYATDYNSENGIASASITITVDNSVPTTITDANNFGHNIDINLQISCSDSVTSCKNLFYIKDGIDGGDTWGSDGNIGILFNTDSNHSLIYFSSNQSDNNESQNITYVAIDKTAPTVTIIQPADGNQWFNSQTVVFDLNDSTNPIDISTLQVDINGVTSQYFDWDGNCMKFNDGNWGCSYIEYTFDTNGADYNLTIFVDDNAGNSGRATSEFKWIVNPLAIWGNVNEFYLEDLFGFDLQLEHMIDLNVIPTGQNDTNGIFNVKNITVDGASAFNVYLDLNIALPNDGNLIVCNQNRRVAADAIICWDINSNSEAKIKTNLAYDANQMYWWFFDLNMIGIYPGMEWAIDYLWRASFGA